MTQQDTLEQSKTGTEISTDSVTLCDETVNDVTLTHIDGQTLEEYYMQADLTVPIDGFTAVSDGKRLLPTDTLQPGATVVVGRMVRNG